MSLRTQIETEWDDKPDEFMVVVSLGELREMIENELD